MAQQLALGLAAALAACSARAGKTDGGTSAGRGGTSGGGATAGGSSGGATYCDGLQITNVGGDAGYLLLYPLAADVTAASCPALVVSQDDAGNPQFSFSGDLSQAGGIWDAYAYGTEPINGLYPGGCDDVGIGNGPSGGTFVVPGGGSAVRTVQQAVAAALDGGAVAPVSFYGVVTFVSPWADGGAGSFYLQDPAAGAPAPRSGIDVYVPAGAGPALVPRRGDEVEVTAVTWAPYRNIDEFLFGAASALSVLARSTPLPPPVVVPAAALAPDSTTIDEWKGMRVVDAEAFTVGASCPLALQYTPGG